MSTLDLPQSLQDLIPKDKASQEALRHAVAHLAQPILHHSLRVYFYAHALATQPRYRDKEPSLAQFSDPARLPLVLVAAALHDIGTCAAHDGPQRFEVEGADHAERHLLAHGYGYEDAHRVWVAVAVHSSPGIAERIDPLARLIRAAVKIDFTRAWQDEYGTAELTAELEAALPRLGAEKCLADLVVGQARERPDRLDARTYWESQKHPGGSWPGGLLRAAVDNPGYEGVNPAF